ncbi:MAG: hypothetical protein HeimC3_13000 [Candidatus Heimdallarchaeota archaeon LC_3]|nr:MAG: hypothetical protein HeimC3_15950 [Candidatus Heimdallarchaeota archaeon LC_3]OLS26026.1 MAG: hypothetical protein HeimC3_13000 [Candidatus Heimdallarchaeota archaeon LC_3]
MLSLEKMLEDEFSEFNIVVAFRGSICEVRIPEINNLLKIKVEPYPDKEDKFSGVANLEVNGYRSTYPRRSYEKAISEALSGFFKDFYETDINNLVITESSDW